MYQTKEEEEEENHSKLKSTVCYIFSIVCVCVFYVSIWSYPLAANLSRMIKYTHTHTQTTEKKQTATTITIIANNIHLTSTHKYGSKWTATNTLTDKHTHNTFGKCEKRKEVTCFSNELKLFMIIQINKHTYTHTHTCNLHTYTRHSIYIKIAESSVKIEHKIVWFLIKNHFQSLDNFSIPSLSHSVSM